jgi:hypothetical protein
MVGVARSSCENAEMLNDTGVSMLLNAAPTIVWEHRVASIALSELHKAIDVHLLLRVVHIVYLPRDAWPRKWGSDAKSTSDRCSYRKVSAPTA